MHKDERMNTNKREASQGWLASGVRIVGEESINLQVQRFVYYVLRIE